MLDAGDNDPVVLWRYVATAVDRVRPGLGRGRAATARRGGQPRRRRGRRAPQCRRRSPARAGHRARRPARGDQPGMPRVDRPRPRAPSAEHARRTRHTRRSGAEARTAACRRCARRGPASRSRVHCCRGATSCSWVSAISRSPRSRSTCSSSAPRAGPRRSCSPGCGCGPSTIPARAVRAFGGDHRFVAEYLSSEVLASLDEDELAFLHGAAVLGAVHRGALRRRAGPQRFGGIGSTSSSTRTSSSPGLERGGWFRIHPLFAEYARAQLAALEPGAPRRIHRRAAEWLRAQGCPSKRSTTRQPPAITSSSRSSWSSITSV